MRLKSDFKSGWGLLCDSKRIKWQTTFRIELNIELLTFFEFFRFFSYATKISKGFIPMIQRAAVWLCPIQNMKFVLKCLIGYLKTKNVFSVWSKRMFIILRHIVKRFLNRSVTEFCFVRIHWQHAIIHMLRNIAISTYWLQVHK